MPIVSASTGRAQPLQFSSLKTRVARAVGGNLDPDVEAAAGEAINDAIIEFNTRLYECNKIGAVQLTLDSNGEATLPTAFYKEIECSLVGSDGTRQRQLNYIDWAEHQHVFNFSQQATNQLGIPTYYTLFNIHLNGKIKILPEVTNASTMYVQITYYRRFALMDENTDILAAPQEIQRAIVLKAQSDMLRIYKSSDPAAWQATQALAQQAWDRFSAIDTKHIDQKFRFRLPPLSINRFPQGDVLYIKA